MNKKQYELTQIIKKAINESVSKSLLGNNLSYEANRIGHIISGDVIKMISKEMSEDVSHELWMSKNEDQFFGFYEKILSSVMAKIYEDYGDSFNTRAGAAPDEW